MSSKLPDAEAPDTTPARSARKPRVTRGSKSSYHHGNLRPALVDGALVLLEEHGAAELSLRVLARRLGVSQAAPYHHFADKNALLAALATEGFERSAKALRAASIRHHSLERRVRGLCAGYLRSARQTPELFHLMYGTQVQRKEDYPDLIAASNAAFEALAALVEEMIADFDIRHVDAKQATITLLALCHGLAHLIVDPRSSPVFVEAVVDDRTIVDHVARLFVTGFRPLSGDGPEAGVSGEDGHGAVDDRRPGVAIPS